MVVDLRDWAGVSSADPVSGITFRRPARSDVAGIGRLYFSAYEPGLVGETVEEAIADMEASWDEEYGALWEEGSLVAEQGAKIVGALLTVTEAPWDQTPEGPFIIELFTDPDVRGGGVARALIERALEAMAGDGARSAGLRVLAENTRAQEFYRSVGFVDWTPTR